MLLLLLAPGGGDACCCSAVAAAEASTATSAPDASRELGLASVSIRGEGSKLEAEADDCRKGLPPLLP